MDRDLGVKDTEPTDVPLHDFRRDRIWCVTVALVCGPTAWMQMLARTDADARRWTKRLLTSLFTVPDVLAGSGRRRLHHLAEPPWPPSTTPSSGHCP